MKFALTLLFALFFLEATAFSMDPSYISYTQTLDDESQRLVYSFADGEISPSGDEPLLMLNGSFTSDVRVVLRNDRALVPIRFLAELFNASVVWGEDDKNVTITINDSIVELTLDYAYVTIDGRLTTLDSAPVIIDGSTYVPLRFISEQFDKNVGYLPGIRTGEGLAHNPVIWIDDSVAQADGERLSELKAKFKEGFEINSQNNIGDRFEQTFNNVVSVVGQDIEDMHYIGPVGRYAMYSGPHITLVEPETGNIYFYKYGNGFGEIHKADLTDPELFWIDYIRG